jgi:hypothetical protein
VQLKSSSLSPSSENNWIVVFPVTPSLLCRQASSLPRALFWRFTRLATALLPPPKARRPIYPRLFVVVTIVHLRAALQKHPSSIACLSDVRSDRSPRVRLHLPSISPHHSARADLDRQGMSFACMKAPALPTHTHLTLTHLDPALLYSLRPSFLFLPEMDALFPCLPDRLTRVVL